MQEVIFLLNSRDPSPSSSPRTPPASPLLFSRGEWGGESALLAAMKMRSGGRWSAEMRSKGGGGGGKDAGCGGGGGGGGWPTRRNGARFHVKRI